HLPPRTDTGPGPRRTPRPPAIRTRGRRTPASHARLPGRLDAGNYSGMSGRPPEGQVEIGMVAGEPSGDLLAARILAGLQARVPGLAAQGIGVPRMLAQGFDAWHPMHALTVFGYVDALKRLPGLLATYRDVQRR